jgi:predicted methyltransferase
MRLVATISIATAVLSNGAALGQEAEHYMVPDNTPAHIRRAVESDARTDQQRARDAGRKPAEIMTLAGIAPGDDVIEFASFGHYYTTMLVDAVGPSGHVYMVDMPWIEPFGGQAARDFAAAHANATFTQVHYNEMSLPDNADVAMMVLFYHDLHREAADETVDTADMNARIFDALRPGGTYVVVDHKAEDGSGWRDAMTLHRSDAQSIIDEVEAAGFELAFNSDLLANPNDDRKLHMRDPSIRGATDRAVLVFRKP